MKYLVILILAMSGCASAQRQDEIARVVDQHTAILNGMIKYVELAQKAGKMPKPEELESRDK